MSQSVTFTASVRVEDYPDFVSHMNETYGEENFDLSLKMFASQLRTVYSESADEKVAKIRLDVIIRFSNLELATFFKLAYGSKMIFDPEKEPA